ncbi:MAG: DUF4013 domain-containing protein [Syntrophaceae bacterium]|nr:DUF4013 domain-containing protein [Syntrophaceae bacterium]
MGDLEKALRYPFTGEGWRAKLAFGAVLYILGNLLGFIPWVGWIFSILVMLIPLGYAYMVFRNHLRGPEGSPLPPWGEWGNLFTRGLSVFLISLGYWIIPGILYWLGKFLWDSGGIAAFLGVLFLILGVGFSLVAFFFLPMALAFYGRDEESFWAAFRWSGIVERIWVVQREYFVGWLASLIFFVVLLLINAYFLYLGWILYSMGIFYLTLAAAHYFGRVCRVSMESQR